MHESGKNLLHKYQKNKLIFYETFIESNILTQIRFTHKFHGNLLFHCNKQK